MCAVYFITKAFRPTAFTITPLLSLFILYHNFNCLSIPSVILYRIHNNFHAFK